MREEFKSGQSTTLQFLALFKVKVKRSQNSPNQYKVNGQISFKKLSQNSKEFGLPVLGKPSQNSPRNLPTNSGQSQCQPVETLASDLWSTLVKFLRKILSSSPWIPPSKTDLKTKSNLVNSPKVNSGQKYQNKKSTQSTEMSSLSFARVNLELGPCKFGRDRTKWRRMNVCDDPSKECQAWPIYMWFRRLNFLI